MATLDIAGASAYVPFLFLDMANKNHPVPAAGKVYFCWLLFTFVYPGF
jgi:hypothetical protein